MSAASARGTSAASIGFLLSPFCEVGWHPELTRQPAVGNDLKHGHATVMSLMGRQLLQEDNALSTHVPTLRSSSINTASSRSSSSTSISDMTCTRPGAVLGLCARTFKAVWKSHTQNQFSLGACPVKNEVKDAISISINPISVRFQVSCIKPSFFQVSQ